jgi:hypothetical protein
VAIDEDGTIAGNVGAAFDPGIFGLIVVWRPVVWHPDGAVTELPAEVTLEGRPATNVRISQVRGGWAAGEAAIVVGGDVLSAQGVVRWHLPTREVRVVPEAGPEPAPLNAHGWLAARPGNVGMRLVTPDGRSHLLTGEGHRAFPLPQPRSLSDDGRTIGGNMITADGAVAVVWRCR